MAKKTTASQRLGATLALAALLSGCGGGGGGSVSSGGGNNGGGSSSGPCSLSSRQAWVQSQLNEWYLFPQDLASNVNAGAYSNIDSYIDALVAPARAQGKDRYFTHMASIAEENAYYNSGSNAGFGFRMVVDTAARQLWISEAFEGTAALAAGIDRGTEILAVGTNTNNLRNVSDILASSGTSGLSQAIAANTHAFRFRTREGEVRTATITKTDYTLTPVSSRYGYSIINDGGRQVGYVNLRTFINTAESPLRAAFASFRNAGVTEVIIDLRYNGGGLVSVADLINNLLGDDRARSDVANYTVFRSSKSSNDSTTYFTPQSQSIAPTRIAFIGTSGTASASELVMNTFIPLLGNRAALIGTNTYGKPVGQIAIDRSECDDRLRVIAFATQNSARQGAYYNGLASFMGTTCRAEDDLSQPLGSTQEASIRAALNFLAGQSCTPIGAAATLSVDRTPTLGTQYQLLTPERPTTAQRDLPGSF